MTARLIRALQRGGCTIDIGNDQWGVWRRHDRRGRMIGTLPGADIEIMRVRSELSELAGRDEPTLVWTGSCQDIPAVSISSDALQSDTDSLPSRTLLDCILRRIHC
ncbi:MAG: hypothetical protein AAGB16_09480, partial [Pseudomonadota bacterium]